MEENNQVDVQIGGKDEKLFCEDDSETLTQNGAGRHRLKNISNHEYGARPLYADNRRERRADKTKGSVRILKDEIEIR